MTPIAPNLPPIAAQYTVCSPTYVEMTPDRHAPEIHSAREAFLDEVLGRPDLSKLSQLLDEQLGPHNWAFTGSTALSIHARFISAPGLAFVREPSDADVLVKETALAKFGYENLKPRCLQEGLQFAGDKRHILSLKRAEKPPLKVDLIKSGETGFGTIEKADPEWIHSVPVLPLKSLQDSLKSRLRTNERTSNSEADLDFVNKLLAHQGENPRSIRATRLLESPEKDSNQRRVRRRFDDLFGSHSPKVLGGGPLSRGLYLDSP